MTERERFFRHVAKGDDCWLWTASTRDGEYGQVWFRGKPELAHRVAYFLEHGTWPALLRHKCDTPLCVRVDHLEPGTVKDNQQDMSERGRSFYQNKTHCPKGHPYSGENLVIYPSSKFRRCRICLLARRRKVFHRPPQLVV